jgi:alkylated DNA repair dioxygenase AlkB
MKTPIKYIPEFLYPHYAYHAMNILWDELAWVQHDKVPRREYYVAKGGQDYAYGVEPYTRTYHSQPMHVVIQEIWNAVEATGSTFDVCFLNGYEGGKDQLGWHADDSPEMDDARPIAIVSLGQPRDIWFREKLATKQKPGFDGETCEGLTLGNGSLCLMAPGMQDTHQHRIPKAGFQPCGPRISLTFRGFVA